MSDFIVKRDNIRIIQMEKEERRELIDSIIEGDKFNNPIFVSFVPATDEMFYGDVIISDTADGVTGEIRYNVNIVALSVDGVSVSIEAVRLGMKEVMKYMKNKKIASNIIYIGQTTDFYISSDLIDIMMVAEDVLCDFKLSDKIELWVEELVRKDFDLLDDCSCDKCKKDKKKDKKKKDKKKKKGKKK